VEHAIDVPAGLDRAKWVRRWDLMQECYLVRRRERLELLAWLVRATQEAPCLVVDLGCGTGSAMAAVLEAVPGAQVVGLDLDERLLVLAEHRLLPFGDRTRLLRRDFRDPASFSDLGPAGAVLSATALHWLAPDELEALYGRIADARGERSRSGGPWEQFWQDYVCALGMTEAEGYRRAIYGEWRGVEEGLPLAWHLDALRAAGLSAVECFWRHDCDAIYGGFR
jgi:SAM-dependent methyltransferase